MRVAAVVLVSSLIAGTVFGETTITINGKTIRTFGSNITVKNNMVIVNGKVVSGTVIEGSGKSASQNRDLGDFTELCLNINANITITAGEESKCRISADDNILPVILTKCSGKVLRISAKESYSSRKAVTIAIEIPLLTKAEINGSGKIDIKGVTKDKLTLAINGSGDITSNGQVKELVATIKGTGALHATELKAASATITINGSGDAEVRATDSLTANVNGSGDIKYVGTPSKIHTTVNGSGDISTK